MEEGNIETIVFIYPWRHNKAVKRTQSFSLSSTDGYMQGGQLEKKNGARGIRKRERDF